MDPINPLLLEIVETWWNEVSLIGQRDTILKDSREGWLDQLSDDQRTELFAKLEREPHLVAQMQVDIRGDLTLDHDRKAQLTPPIIRYINLDADGLCWRDGDTGLPETHATREQAEAASEADWQARREGLLADGGPEALEGEAKDETFACTVNPDGSVTLADGATVIPATDPADPNP